MRRVLVIGAAGFAGRHLLRELSRRGFDVVATYFRTFPKPDAALVAERWMRCDIRDADQVGRVIESATPDAVVHLAAMSIPARANADPASAYETNVRGWQHVVDGVRCYGRACRTLLVSSSYVYGLGPPAFGGFRESHQSQPYDIYGTTRRAAEDIARLQFEDHGLDVVIARAFNHCGPTQSPHYFVATLVGQVASRIARASVEPILVGDLNVARDFTDVRDVVGAYADLLTAGESGETYNVCSGQPVSLRAVVETLGEVVEQPFEVVSDTHKGPNRQPSIVFGCRDRIEQATGWTPSISLAETLRDTYDDCQRHLPDQIGVTFRETESASA